VAQPASTTGAAQCCKELVLEQHSKVQEQHSKELVQVQGSKELVQVLRSKVLVQVQVRSKGFSLLCTWRAALQTDQLQPERQPVKLRQLLRMQLQIQKNDSSRFLQH